MARNKDFDEEDVLQKAMQLFWHKGYNGTSMQDLVDALGISRSSLYDTFGDKYALYTKALTRYRDSAGSTMCSILSEPLPAKEAIKRLLEVTSASLLNDRQDKGCFLVNAEVELAAHDPALKDLIVVAEEQMERAYYEVILRGQQNGEISAKHDARALTRFMLNTVKGMQVSAKSTHDPVFFDDVITMALAVLDHPDAGR